MLEPEVISSLIAVAALLGLSVSTRLSRPDMLLKRRHWVYSPPSLAWRALALLSTMHPPDASLNTSRISAKPRYCSVSSISGITTSLRADTAMVLS